MGKRLLIHSFVVFVVFMIYGYVVHGVLLHDIYNEVPGLWRTQAETNTLSHWFAIAYLLMAVPFAAMFAKGFEDKGLGEGLRFGLYTGVFLGSVNFIYYAVQPRTMNMTLLPYAADIGMTVLAGLALAAIYKPE